MYYCENCYLLNEDDVCAFCGSRLTRGPKADDYCFIGTKTSPWAEMLQGILEVTLRFPIRKEAGA